ncbi:glycosyltransferase family 39 protein [Arthrobacter sp. H5]|uniref:dolichyl-phosphate-mannose--protein mannosyltransferase n=1 Tax=Arthrobacter sp. H5 TaxID=1267973 RepID=UPI0009DEC31F|nr:glycosyltransferase family 39 protein [Arthrobacter sp. H5]
MGVAASTMRPASGGALPPSSSYLSAFTLFSVAPMGTIGRVSQAAETTARPHPDDAQATWVSSAKSAFSHDVLLRRLIGERLPLSVWTWLLPLAVAVIGGVLRFVRLGEPGTLIFDETYYVKDAFSFLQSGYEREWPEGADEDFNQGNTGVILGTPDYVVHPPVGKWMIAFGMAVFGSDNAFGWRFSAALVGTLSILMIALIASRLLGSPVLGAVAGLLLAVDGHHLVHSRTSLLDVFLMFWVLAAFGALLLDRDHGRRRLAAKLAALASKRGRPAAAHLLYGPWLGLRPWRIAAGVALGLALGTKWSALPYIAVFGLMTVLWDMNARRTAGIRHWVAGAVVRDGLQAFLSIVPVAFLTYLASWTGWFLSSDAYNRQWVAENPDPAWDWVPAPLRSLAEYHRSAYSFHEGLSSEHPYESTAWSWLFMGRPTSFYYPDEAAGCGAQDCSSAINVVGNPLIWWSAAAALLVVMLYWLGRRDWRAGAILAGVAAGYLPWFFFPDRTMFFFYAIVFEPFLVLALTYVLGLLLGRTFDPPWRRRSGIVLVGGFVAVAVLLSAFFLPIWTAEVIPYSEWRLRMWMPSWI